MCFRLKGAWKNPALQRTTQRIELYEARDEVYMYIYRVCGIYDVHAYLWATGLYKQILLLQVSRVITLYEEHVRILSFEQHDMCLSSSHAAVLTNKCVTS